MHGTKNMKNKTIKTCICTILIVSLLLLSSCQASDENDSENSGSDTQSSESYTQNYESYTITFDPQKGHLDWESQVYKRSDTVEKLPQPTRENYAFMGWYTEKRGSTKANFEEYNSATGSSFKLYARWAPKEYYQFDEKWAAQAYNNGENNDTVRGSGCGPGVMAIADATINDSDADIGTACKWSVDNDFFTTANGRTKDEFFEAYGKEHNLNVTQLNKDDLRNINIEEASKYHEEAFKKVKDGNWMVAFMGKGKWTTGGHFVLWYDISDDEDVFIRDTNSMKPHKAQNTFEEFKKTVIRYWEIQVPDDKKLV